MIHPDTRVLIQNIGYVPIRDKRKPFIVWTGERVVYSNLSVAEPRSAVTVKLVNGVSLTCSADQKIRVKSKGGVKASDLTNSDYVYLTDSTFEFDYVNVWWYEYINRLTSYELGVLLGIVRNTRTGDTLDIAKTKKETYQELERLLRKCDVEFTKEEYYKRARRIKYALDESFFYEVEDMDFEQGYNKEFWKSKLLLKGYLKALFTFGQIGKETLSIRSAKDSNFLKNIQQALLLFGVNSSYIRGLKNSQLIIFKKNCYRFANNIGVFNPETLFEGLDYTQFLEYKDRTTNDMRYSKVQSVSPSGYRGKLVGLDVNHMANGVVLDYE
jgi:hypothetical protein